jgi:tRNA threonylcarbamoyladenosine biosynthesis protein TsaE
MSETRIETFSAEETRKFGSWLSQFLKPNDVVGLVGELGAGKTVLAQGIGEGLRVVDEVKSPSFTVVNEYEGRIKLYHMDMYRLRQEDFLELGLEEYLGRGGVAVIEWADKIEKYLPEGRILITISIGPNRQRELALGGSKEIDVGAWNREQR